MCIIAILSTACSGYHVCTWYMCLLSMHSIPSDKVLALFCGCRFLVKKQQEVQALKVFSRIYGSEEKARSQVSEIRSTMMKKGKAEPFKERLKYIMRWNILQRFVLLL